MGSVFSYFPQNRIKLKTSSLRIKAAIILSIFYRASIQRNKTTTKEEYLHQNRRFFYQNGRFCHKKQLYEFKFASA